jgi:cyanate permease
MLSVDDDNDGDSIPSNFFFEFYTLKAQSAVLLSLRMLNPKDYIISKTSEFLSGYLESVSSDFVTDLVLILFCCSIFIMIFTFLFSVQHLQPLSLG